MAEITIRISDKALKVAGVILGAVFLVWSFSQVWSLGAFRPKYQIQMFVPEAEGVRVGTLVRLDGMPIGNASRVKLVANSADSARRIEIVLRIEKRFQNMIHEDSYASLVRGGLLGERYVSIQRGFSGPPINAEGEIRVVPVKEATLTDLINALGKNAGCQNEQNSSPNGRSPIAAKKPPSSQ
jgi:ABC-type transporter Mla subunit MlaD